MKRIYPNFLMIRKILFLIFLLFNFVFLKAQTTFWDDDFETDKGWTLNGEFERGDPNGGSGTHGNPNPTDAYDGTNVLGSDIDGAYGNNRTDRQVNAVSPTIDCSSYTNIHLTFQRWLNVESDDFDNAYIDVWDGSAWQNVWNNPVSNITETAWSYQDIDISTYADRNVNLQIRFAIGTTDGSFTFSGWNIDDLEITGTADASCECFSEDFESYSIGSLPGTGDGSPQWLCWSETSSVNNWYMGDDMWSAGNQAITIGTSSTNTSVYNNSDDASVGAYYYKKIDARNFNNVKLSFKWRSNGEAGNDYGQVAYSTNLTDFYYLSNQFQGQSTTQSETDIDFSAVDGKSFYIGFKWTNNSSVGSDPPFSVDDIEITGTPKLNYGFSTTQGTFTQISGTIITSFTDEGAVIPLPSGFDFNFIGEIYDNIRVSQNGWLHFYNTSPGLTGTGATNDLINNDLNPLLAPLWDNLTYDSQSRIIYKTEGTSPNRVFIVEWRDIIWGSASDRQNFQIKLYETSHEIEYIYGQMNTPTGGTSSIGIKGACGNPFMSVTPGSTATVSESAANNSISSASNLTSGLIYVFSPYRAQSYLTWQNASILIGQQNWTDNLIDISTEALGRVTTPTATSSAVSSKNALVVGSNDQHRILLWNQIPTTDGESADVVIGQTDWTSSTPGTTASTLRRVSALCFTPDGEKLIVADKQNHRVLIWNTIPTSNGEAADVVIGQADMISGDPNQGVTVDANTLRQPTGVIVSNDGKLIITDHNNNRVLIFNKVPTTNNASADVVIGQSLMTTSASSTSQNGLDFPWDVGLSPDGKLLISDDNNNRVLVFNSIPTSNGANADYVIGQTDFVSGGSGTAADKFNQPNVTVSPEGKLACGDWGNHRVLIFNKIPTSNGESADEVLGQDSFTELYEFSTGSANGTPTQRNMSYPYSVNFDLNGRLLVNGSAMNRVMLYGEVPQDESDVAVAFTNDAGGTVCIGTPLTFTLTVTNNGPDRAENVVVTCALPSQFNLTSSNASFGRYESNSGYWSISALANGESETLTLEGDPLNGAGGDDWTAYARVLLVLQKDNDFSNNTASSTVTISNNNIPTISTIADQVINTNSNTGAIAFTVTDPDAGEGTNYTLTRSTSNTNLVTDPNIVYGGTAPNQNVTVTPETDQYGYATIRVTATDVNGCSDYEEFLITVGNIWEGDDLTDPEDWAVGGNWSTSNVPSSTTIAIIPENPQGGQNFPTIKSTPQECEDLIIEQGAYLNINDGNRLSIYGDILLESDAVRTASLVDLNTQANINAGNGIVMEGTNQKVTVERYMDGGAWHYISPATTQSSSSLFTTDYGYSWFNSNFYYYDETNLDDDWKLGWTKAFIDENTPSRITPGLGYAIMYDAWMSPVTRFEGGELNSGDIDIPVTHTTGHTDGAIKEGWTLLGNPYPCGLDADDFISANVTGTGTINQTINGTLYLWDEPGTSGFGDNSGLYAYYNGAGFLGSGSGSVLPDKYLSSGQAFFVQTTSAGNVSFRNTMKEQENSNFFKSAKNTIKRIRVSIEDNKNTYNETLVALTDNALDGFDSHYDALKLREPQDLAIYSFQDESELAIQSLPNITEETGHKIKLGVNAPEAGKYIIRNRILENIPDNHNVILVDNKENKTIDFKKASKYFVNLNKGEDNERFELHINIGENVIDTTETADTTNIVDDISQINQDKYHIYSYEDYVYIRSITPEYERCRLSIRNLMGQLVYQNIIELKELVRFNPNLKQGVYMVVLESEETKQIQKLVIF